MDADVIVLGAGIVGLSCALHLQERGQRVVVLDRREPGRETSFGNAGILARGSILPLNGPGLWRKLPGTLLGRDPSIRLDPLYLPSLAPWLLAFVRNSNEARFRDAVTKLDALLKRAVPEHEALIGAAGAQALLRSDGWIKLYRSDASFAASGREQTLLAEAGVRFQALDAAALSELEPRLNPVFKHGLWIVDNATVRDPGAICTAFAALFHKRGGNVRQGDALSLRAEGDTFQVDAKDGAVAAPQAVVALGPWSDDLLRRFGYRFPLAVERGYHMHYSAQGNATLNRPVYDVEGGYVLAPMETGLRLSTGVELARRDAPPTPVQLRRVVPTARTAFPLGEPLSDVPWLGRRPSLPDSLPVIGRARRHPNLWLAFGHGHIGFSTGPVTGRLIAELMTGDAPVIDPDPYAPERFARA